MSCSTNGLAKLSQNLRECSGNAAKNLSGYVILQEYGNSMGTRWITVTDDNGKGLRFEAEDTPFESSVLPYSCYELEQAMHIYELPKPHYTWVRIMGGQMGVGGDDSWGALSRSNSGWNSTKTASWSSLSVRRNK